jgi:hypothetical protein
MLRATNYSPFSFCELDHDALDRSRRAIGDEACVGYTLLRGGYEEREAQASDLVCAFVSFASGYSSLKALVRKGAALQAEGLTAERLRAPWRGT